MGRDVRLFCITLLLTGFALSSRSSHALRADLYTEQAFLGREQAIIQQTRMRASQLVAQGLSPYLQAGQELMTAGFGSLRLDSGASFAYVAPGVRYNLGPISLFGEVRARAFYVNRKTSQSPQRVLDARVLAVFGKYWALRLGASSDFSLFLEPYTELLFTSGDLENVILAGYLRGGLRWQLARGLTADVYVEPFATIDRVRHYYNNRADVKPSVRVTYTSTGFQASLLASYLFNRYFPRGDFDRNPYIDREAGLRILAVIGGTF